MYHAWKPATGTPIEVVVVQPNHDPYNEQYTIGPAAAIQNFLNLATPLITPNTRFVVGPESMIQENIWERHLDQSSSVQSLQQFAQQMPNLTLIAGASSFRMRYAHEPVTVASRTMDSSFMNSYASWFNVPTDSLTPFYEALNLGFALDAYGVQGLTHKSKLVAGVERMPFKKYLSAIAGDLALDLGGTVGTLASDPEREVFTHKPSGSKYGVAICYESVFGDFFSEFVRNGAQYMMIITNDGWWGNTPGHRQHNAFASLRAIETRRDIARSANTGISAFINSRGDILQPTAYWEPDAIKGTVTPSDRITFYVRHGDYLGRMAMVIAILLILIRFSYSIVPLKFRKSR
jgi:apolipoprotein N-acyltransferase